MHASNELALNSDCANHCLWQQNLYTLLNKTHCFRNCVVSDSLIFQFKKFSVDVQNC